MVPGLLGLLALCLTAVAVIHSERTTVATLESLMKRRVAALAELCAALTQAGVGGGYPDITRRFVEGTRNVPQMRLVGVIDSDGSVLHAATPKGMIPPAEAQWGVVLLRPLFEEADCEGHTVVQVVDDGRLVAAASVFRLVGNEKERWRAFVVSDLQELKSEERASHLRSAIWMAAITLAAALAVWWYFVAQVHRPIRRLQDTLGELSRGRFDVRVTPGGPPELSRLAESVDTMARELESRDKALQKARGDLEDSEQCLALALRAADQGVIQCDLDSGTIRVSTWIADRLGWIEPAMAAGLSEWLVRVHPADRALVEGLVEEHRKGRTECRCEHRMRTSAGSWEWIAVETRLLPGTSGCRIAGSLQFVTERKESYLLLVAQLQLLEFIAAGRPLGETFRAILHFAESEAEDVRCSILLADERRTLHPVEGGSLPEEIRRAVDGLPIAEGSAVCGTAAHRRERVAIPDVLLDPNCEGLRDLAERHRIRACWSTPILRTDGRLLGVFSMYVPHVGLPDDRHDQVIRIATHMAGFAIQRSLDDAGLRESEARFRYLADTAPVMIWMADAQGRTTFLSRPWLEFVGEADEPHALESWRERIHPDDRLLCEAMWRHALQSGRRFEVQYRLRRRDGEFRWLLSSGVPRFGSGGELAGFLGSAIDVTGQRALEEHVRQSQKMESIGRLAAGVAHDFNNILTVILGNTALLPGAGPAGISRAAEEIGSAAERAARLTRQLLLFSRQQPFQAKAVEIDALIRGFVGMMSRLVGEDIRVEYHSEGPLPPVEADPGLLEQVLLNLAANARDAMPHGGRLSLSSRLLAEGVLLAAPGELRPGPHVQVVVQDTGPGIPLEILPRIFDPFFTTKAVGKGTGLGLATAYGILQQHGGRIWAESPPGGGARFTILLPVASAGTPEPPAAEAPTHLPRGGEHILVVEDDPGLLTLCESFLSRHGYRVTTAASGPDALVTWRRSGPVFDLLLTDLVMPGGLAGPQLAEILHAEVPGLPVIYTSGYGRGIEAGEERAVPANGHFLQKPYAMAELVRLVRRVLDEARRGPA